MEDALRVVAELNQSIWDALKDSVADLGVDEIDWRPLPQANSITSS